MVDWTIIKSDSKGNIDLKLFLQRQEFVQYEAKAIDQRIWKLKALSLLHAANKLFQIYDAAETRQNKRDLELAELSEKHEPISYPIDSQEKEDVWDEQLLYSFALLTGYAVENIIKGIIYANNPSRLLEDDKNLFLHRCETDHDLTKLFVEARLATDESKIDPETKEILDWLKDYITWRGRYAIPLNSQIYRNRKPIPRWLQYPDKPNLNLEKITLLIERLIDELDKLPIPPTHLAGDK